MEEVTDNKNMDRMNPGYKFHPRGCLLFVIVILLLLSLSVFSQTVNDLRPTVTMKEYVDGQIQGQKEFTQAQFQNVLDNVNKANASMEKRLDGINEFRGQLKDQAGTFITRSELFAWVMALLMAFFAYANYMRNKPKKEEVK